MALAHVNSTTIVINPELANHHIFLETLSYPFIVQFNMDLLIKKSICLSYKACAVTPNVAILGTPVYSPFLRVDSTINSQTSESVNQCSQVCQAWVQCNKSVANKAGCQTAYGYLGADDGSLTNFDYSEAQQFNKQILHPHVQKVYCYTCK